MKQLFWFVAAVLVHVGFLLFGKALFPSAPVKEQVKVTEVDLTETVKEEEKPQEQEPEKAEQQVQAAPEQMVDMKAFEEPPPAGPAALAPMSLSDLAGALNGAGGESFFGGAGGITSGGVIGGTGAGGFGGAGMADALAGDVDEKPRALGSPEIKLPPELRKVKGKVIVKIIVDENGRIMKPQIESSTNSVLNKHVLDGIVAMRFEPATRGGKKVSAKVRLPIVLG
ncbi:MAG: energy transducer TonB [Verrucomicrobiaceae bacterium]|nr:energy transducer TonB [Verrucomicrobiaceae bacterium]